MSKTIALLGQPNSGKSSLFNGLTGSHQHVGNWPGKTVEHKEGVFTFQGEEYHVIDLPGSYSLSAGSEEEVITTDYIASGKADLVAVLVDSSQLERSLYMFTDFIGINIPVILILNLMDVAKMKGIQIDTAKIQKKLGIPVMDFVAADIRRYVDLKEKLAEAIDSGRMAQSSLLMKYYYQDPDCHFEELTEKQQETAVYTKEKLAVQELEKTDRGLMISGKHKYELIDSILADAVKRRRAVASLAVLTEKHWEGTPENGWPLGSLCWHCWLPWWSLHRSWDLEP